MRKIVAGLYNIMDKRSLRALTLVLALALGGCIFFDPAAFAANTSSLSIWHGFVLMWAVCAGVVHGVGFYPRALFWQGVLCPPLAALVLLAGLIFFFAYAH